MIRLFIDKIFIGICLAITLLVSVIGIILFPLFYLLKLCRLKNIMYFLLFIIAILLSVTLFPIGVIYNLTQFHIDDWKRISISLDQSGNVILHRLLDKAFIKNTNNYVSFGDEDLTISETLESNRIHINHNKQYKDNSRFTILGIMMINLLNTVDKGHIS